MKAKNVFGMNVDGSSSMSSVYGEGEYAYESDIRRQSLLPMADRYLVVDLELQYQNRIICVNIGYEYW